MVHETRRVLRALPSLMVLSCAADPPRQDYHEPRQPCQSRDPLRQVFFGDLHVHTGYSFDAHAFDVRTTPEDAYRFARGGEVRLPPLDGQGQGTQALRLRRPLDFAAVTDHSEFLGEVEACTVPGSSGFDSAACRDLRRGGNGPVSGFGVVLASDDPKRQSEICGADGCAGAFGAVWQRVQAAAQAAYDRSPACSFTSFIGYEYSGSPGFSTLHRNVIFRSDRVPAPVTYFEQPTPVGLWRELSATCLRDPGGCDVLAIPHNSNESNGNAFVVESADSPEALSEQRERAALRAQLEPVAEIYQHKGDSECMNGLSGILGAPDELCDFEKHRRTPMRDCGEGTGSGGVARMGCFSRRDFLRGALLAGLAEEARLGENPYRLGFVASTDTHNGTPGATDEDSFLGHRGSDDDTPPRRLGNGELTQGGIEFSPGGLAAVWAEENTREGIFDALRRREVYGTSGPRAVVRLFGGTGLPDGLCGDGELARKGYAGGVPMGGVLHGPGPDPGVTPRLVVAAQRDPDGPKLALIQIIKGWVRQGQQHVQIYDVAGRRDNGASVDVATCQVHEAGADSLCASFVDPDFRPGEQAFYYARVLHDPTCRWSTYACNALPIAERPPACTAPEVPRTVRERVWTSPIWYQPG